MKLFKYDILLSQGKSDVVCYVALLYSDDGTKVGISFIFQTVNLFRITLNEREI